MQHDATTSKFGNPTRTARKGPKLALWQQPQGSASRAGKGHFLTFGNGRFEGISWKTGLGGGGGFQRGAALIGIPFLHTFEFSVRGLDPRGSRVERADADLNST